MATLSRLTPVMLLAAASLTGNFLYRSFVHGDDRERLLHVAAGNLEGLPEAIGPWRMQASETLSDDVLRILDCRSYQSRFYISKETGEQVALILLAGSAGPLLAHTPDVCYASSGLAMTDPVGPEVVRGTGAQADTFHRATVLGKSVDQKRSRVYYAWRTFDGRWQAPDHPRLVLGGQPMLYKLQVVGEAGALSDEASVIDPARRFLDDLLPVLDQSLKPN